MSTQNYVYSDYRRPSWANIHGMLFPHTLIIPTECIFPWIVYKQLNKMEPSIVLICRLVVAQWLFLCSNIDKKGCPSTHVLPSSSNPQRTFYLRTLILADISTFPWVVYKQLNKIEPSIVVICPIIMELWPCLRINIHRKWRILWLPETPLGKYSLRVVSAHIDPPYGMHLSLNIL